MNKQSFANRDEEKVAGYAKLEDTIFKIGKLFLYQKTISSN